MLPKRWFAAIGVVAVAIAVAVVTTALTWPQRPEPIKSSAPSDGLNVSLVTFAGGFFQPVAIASTPIVTDTRLFVVERSGFIRVVQANGTVLPTPFLNITSLVDSQTAG